MWGYETEEQQIEAIKQFWKSYGTLILSVFSALIVAWFGWQYWQNSQEDYRSQASLSYQQLLQSVVDQQDDIISIQAKQIIDTYPRSPYAQLSALLLAEQAIAANNLPQAEQQLHWAANNGTDKAVQQIAAMRLARVYIANGQAQQAISLLRSVDDVAFMNIAKAIEGDALVAMGDIAAAQEAYQQALKNMTADNPWYDLVNMKLVNLAPSA